MEIPCVTDVPEHLLPMSPVCTDMRLFDLCGPAREDEGIEGLLAAGDQNAILTTEHVMGGSTIPGPRCGPDPSIQDGTLTLNRSSKPGLVCTVLNPDGDFPQNGPPATLTISVFFFGGYKSTSGQMDDWIKSAHGQRPDVTFNAYPYPSDNPEPSDKDIDTFKKVIKTINDSTAGKIFIVGHSSGCAIANGVDQRLKDTTKVTLVALDGFAPNANQLKRSQVWAAVSGTAKSFNHDRLLKRVGEKRLQIFHAGSDCTTELALHFSLVNVSANDKDLKSFKTDLGNGYKACEANLCWL
jgi:hypothetical protein